VRDLFIARIEQGEIETYQTPRRLAKAIKIELTTEVAEGVLYADDSIDETVKEFVSGEIKINANDITTADEADLLGAETDADGVIYSSGDDSAPYWAVSFRAKKADGQFTYVWLYKVKFGIPDEAYDTKADSITFSTPTITGTFIKRDSDGLWRAKYTGRPNDATATTWFNSVRNFAQ
jgi:phi13 family phage major tail protein